MDCALYLNANSHTLKHSSLRGGGVRRLPAHPPLSDGGRRWKEAKLLTEGLGQTAWLSVVWTS